MWKIFKSKVKLDTIHHGNQGRHIRMCKVHGNSPNPDDSEQALMILKMCVLG